MSPWSEESNESNYLAIELLGEWNLSANKVTLIYKNDAKVEFNVSLEKSMDGTYMRHTTFLTPDIKQEKGLQSCELKMNLMEYIKI